MENQNNIRVVMKQYERLVSVIVFLNREFQEKSAESRSDCQKRSALNHVFFLQEGIMLLLIDFVTSFFMKQPDFENNK